jgi:hypothetical protein
MKDEIQEQLYILQKCINELNNRLIVVKIERDFFKEQNERLLKVIETIKYTNSYEKQNQTSA